MKIGASSHSIAIGFIVGVALYVNMIFIYVLKYLDSNFNIDGYIVIQGFSLSLIVFEMLYKCYGLKQTCIRYCVTGSMFALFFVLGGETGFFNAVVNIIVGDTNEFIDNAIGLLSALSIGINVTVSTVVLVSKIIYERKKACKERGHG